MRYFFLEGTISQITANLETTSGIFPKSARTELDEDRNYTWSEMINVS